MRKEALEALEKLVANPKIEGGQYGELLGALKKVSTNQKQDVSRSADHGTCPYKHWEVQAWKLFTLYGLQGYEIISCGTCIQLFMP